MLTFEPRVEGFRVCRGDVPIASMMTKTVDPAPSPTMPDETFQALKASDGEAAALAARDQYAQDRALKVTAYKDLPVDECTIHSCGGALSVADIKKMLAHLAS